MAHACAALILQPILMWMAEEPTSRAGDVVCQLAPGNAEVVVYLPAALAGAAIRARACCPIAMAKATVAGVEQPCAGERINVAREGG